MKERLLLKLDGETGILITHTHTDMLLLIQTHIYIQTCYCINKIFILPL